MDNSVMFTAAADTHRTSASISKDTRDFCFAHCNY
jgi:hypothetical protein